MQCFEKVGDRGSHARELASMGHTLRAMNRSAEALDMFNAALAIAEEIGDVMLVGSCAYTLAQMAPPLPQFISLRHNFASAPQRRIERSGARTLARCRRDAHLLSAAALRIHSSVAASRARIENPLGVYSGP